MREATDNFTKFESSEDEAEEEEESEDEEVLKLGKEVPDEDEDEEEPEEQEQEQEQEDDGGDEVSVIYFEAIKDLQSNFFSFYINLLCFFSCFFFF